uniref:DNA-directed RNA polymerase subunit n=1 Tax=Geranium carolinianum TaxID=554690 RepID=B7T381_9ROSI|nr:RNA polymerase beta [Geranium carolinianum]
MIDRYKHQQLQIGLVSPQQISAWANKTLPNGEIVGEVTEIEHVEWETNKPKIGGFFCERIFGPIKSGICACGHYGEFGDQKEKRTFCGDCGVEFANSRIRRYQMGYIKLACPVTHVWYLRRLPSYIANLLDKPLKELEDLVYCDFAFTRPIAKKPTILRLRGSFEYETQSWKDSIPPFFTIEGLHTFREISTGAGAIREQLGDLDLRVIIDSSLAEWKELEEEGLTGDEWEDRKIERRKRFLVRRMGLAKHFIRTNVEPEWMVLCLLPVLPPGLRPAVQIGELKRMGSDINDLYGRVLSRNNDLLDLLTIQSTPGDVVMSQERLVQEAVDTLLDNGIRGEPIRDGHNKVYKSFTDLIEGKEGRFRETLLGKRVDYSGRSVIVVGPSLSLHQCGLPREIAIELFQTFLLRGLIRQHLAPNLGTAKSQIREKERIVWEILQEVMKGHPVLLNRAPTLHRLGIQAFQPILVEGRAICLHPLVCKGFNADRVIYIVYQI